MYTSTIFFAASLAIFAFAKTDLTGCTSTDVSSPAGASIAWYVPGTGEICDFLDCGGGRAPPKTTVPGCPLYSGTLTYSPSYFPGFGSATSASASATESQASASTSESQIPSESLAASYSESATAELTTSSAAAPSTLITSGPVTTTAAGTGAVNGTSPNVSPNGNGTFGGATPSISLSMSAAGAMETARVWIGGVGLVGLGAIVAAL